MIVSPTGWIAPAPSPWTARQAMRAPMLPAKPHPLDPTRNSAVPARSTGLRPWRSASFPWMGTVTVAVSMYAANAQA